MGHGHLGASKGARRGQIGPRRVPDEAKLDPDDAKMESNCWPDGLQVKLRCSFTKVQVKIAANVITCRAHTYRRHKVDAKKLVLNEY